ncbi:hypothetical protein CWI42_020190 [Ordospora colligata]|uniref:Uncharacterized protein n=1 Tax=Ordospora colligata OC4 TaxID=1354746 RepID=A0A0B2UGJ2_9MICR|nr:uncharacterized protein M896_020200 [Ordospora colligata OC4]KHN70186.1 hypothetical protein M896_020200 [Ordospora colligata OC4]TBU16730.1 hypothetical protein CWI41_020210 [Ordospora colligata]TBU17036.1 hypothetical protein CWI40_020210 [Ordospora colligata]TBU19460.1 hypothetical protein CWI42_020190 [Ordospora colligata]
MKTVSKNRRFSSPFVLVWKLISKLYYRYTLEMGICILEWWEVVLVNTYFLLLTSSFIKQMIKVTKCVYKMIIKLPSIFKSKMRVHSNNTTITST